jgi:hypothetical protein
MARDRGRMSRRGTRRGMKKARDGLESRKRVR